MAPPRSTRRLRGDALGRRPRLPRWFHVLPNGDVLVAEAQRARPGEDPEAPENEGMPPLARLGRSANRITLFRDADGDGSPNPRDLPRRLNQPFGMALLGDSLYVANTDGVLVFLTGRGDADRGAGREDPRPPRRRLQQPLDPQRRGRPGRRSST